MSTIHTFPVSVRWSGATVIDGGATEYSRDATVDAPGKPGIVTSAAPAYQGNAARWNPEDLFAAALGTCHMLTFFALARKAGINVLGYDDDAVATMEMVANDGANQRTVGSGNSSMRISTMKLSPRISVAADADHTKVRELFEKAHKYCFVANSVTTKVEMSPTIVVA
jgi:organic hydroperoxide reductase OsmC/OhrA